MFGVFTLFIVAAGRLLWWSSRTTPPPRSAKAHLRVRKLSFQLPNPRSVPIGQIVLFSSAEGLRASYENVDISKFVGHFFGQSARRIDFQVFLRPFVFGLLCHVTRSSREATAALDRQLCKTALANFRSAPYT